MRRKGRESECVTRRETQRRVWEPCGSTPAEKETWFIITKNQLQMSAHRFLPLSPIIETHAKICSASEFYLIMCTHTQKNTGLQSEYLPVHALLYHTLHYGATNTCLHTPCKLDKRNQQPPSTLTYLDYFPLLFLCACQWWIMKMSIKSITGVMSSKILSRPLCTPKPFSCCTLFHCVCHYVLFRVVTVITQPSSGFSVICLQIFGFHCLEEGICELDSELDNGPQKSCTGNMTKMLFDPALSGVST